MRSIPTLIRGVLCAALLATLAACGGSADDVPDSHIGFEPVTCSTTPSPCA